MNEVMTLINIPPSVIRSRASSSIYSGLSGQTIFDRSTVAGKLRRAALISLTPTQCDTVNLNVLGVVCCDFPDHR